MPDPFANYDAWKTASPYDDDDGSDWLQSALDDHGVECGNCGEWRILADDRRTIKACVCGDEEFDLYDATEDGP
jgi:hypothetical protein